MFYVKPYNYAIRALIWLSNHDQYGQAQEIAKAEKLPEFYTTKILRKLSKAGILTSHQGRNGGFALSRKPEKIQLVQVFEALTNLKFKNSCLVKGRKCSNRKPCTLHHYMKELKGTLYKNLKEVSLRDIAKGEPK